jgi:hypothetical protein
MTSKERSLDEQIRTRVLSRMQQHTPTPKMGRRAFVEEVCGIECSDLLSAILDASDGRPVPALIRTMGTSAPIELYFGAHPEPRYRRTVCVRAGGRAGKTSRMVAPAALHAAWTVPLPTLARGEFASALMVAPDLRLAHQTLSFVRGYVEGSEMLRAALIGEPTKDHVELRRPDGAQVRIEVLPASARGTATRARTLVFAALDEAAFFFGEGNAVNDEEIYVSVMQRLVPGAQCWVVSTPWIAGEGLLEKLIERDFGKHDRALCVTAPTRALNPTWDPTGEIERDLREHAPDKATREIDGIPLRSGSRSFFDPLALERAKRAHAMPRVPRPGEHVQAGGDLGFRSDSSALCITHLVGRRILVADLLELRPEGEPLRPSAVVSAFGDRCRAHAGLSFVMADGHYRETLDEHLAEYGLGYCEAPTDVALVYQRARQLIHDGRVEIPDVPMGHRLVAQLRSIQWRPNPGGSVSILLPREAKGGHCDLAAAFVLALWQAGGLEVPEEKPRTVEEYWAREEKAERERDFERYGKKPGRERDWVADMEAEWRGEGDS